MSFIRVIVVSIFSVGVIAVLPADASAASSPVTNQIKITAVILPAKYVIVDTEDKIQQIISNSSNPDVEPAVYRLSLKPDNLIPITPDISANVDELLEGKELKPGILYDYRNVEKVPIKTSISKSNTNTWLSGIFNLKNVNSTVNLTRL